MDNRARMRWTVIGSALALTIVAIFYPVEEAPAAHARRVPRAALPPLVSAEPAAAQQAQLPPEAVDVDPFAPRNWQAPALPPPPAPVAVAAPVQAEPAAPAGPPPLPFQYMGRMNDDGNLVVYLSRGDQIFIAKPGEVLEGTYKVLETSARQIALLHVPSGEKQMMSLPATEN